MHPILKLSAISLCLLVGLVSLTRQATADTDPLPPPAPLPGWPIIEPVDPPAGEPLLTSATPLSCRHGASMAYLSAQLVPSDWVGLNWFLTFDISDRFIPDDAELIRMIRFKPRFDEDGERTGDYFHAWSPTGNDDGSDNGIPNEYHIYPDFDDPAFEETVLLRPGTLWVIGNEMAVSDVQDSLLPATYAKAYHDAYRAIKRIDPSAQVAVGAILQVSPARLQYLDKVLAAYRERYGRPLPADAWTFHAYILSEAVYYDETGTRPSPAGPVLGVDQALAWTNAALEPGVIDTELCAEETIACVQEHDSVESFESQVWTMRRWLADNGYRDLPLMLTEWGVLYPASMLDEAGQGFGYERAARFLDETLTVLETASDPEIGYRLDGGRLVQRWSWYNSYIPGLEYLGGPSSLVYPDGTLTPVGEVYWAHTQASAARLQGTDPNLRIEAVTASGTVLPVGSGQGEIRLSVTVRNLAETNTQSETVIQFEDQRGETVGSVTIPAGVPGCGTGRYTGDTVWGGLYPGAHRVTARFEGETLSSDLLPEEGERRSATGFVGKFGVYMPWVGR